ncbi:TadA family conjugal transfer-associated ATPase [Streptomyces sp. NPDC006879]|uniref:TadA family conjugal transfer-associated ATPase n=1 Tax=Streptomyces sp. NPDC006879 TaxID=3364767 RepID=UPI00367E32DD
MSTPLLEAVRRRLAESGAEPTPARVAEALRAQRRLLGHTEVLGAAQELRSELVGAGPLQPLLMDPAVTDVLVAAPDRVWVDRGQGLELTTVVFEGPTAVRRLATRLAAAAGRRLDDARPWVDARLPDGTRLHAVLPPVAVGSACLSLRVVRPRAFSLDELAAAGTLPPGGQQVLLALLRSRLSFLISGGTGTGKTTLLSSLLGLVGPGERIVLAEDSGELRPDHPHVVRLETRPANQEGAGAVTLADLVRQALRMRPDRLVVGEVRGAEVADLLAALNTGHEGECLPKPYIELGSEHRATPLVRHGGGSARARPGGALQGRTQPLADLGAGRPVSGRTIEHVGDETPQHSGHVHGAVRARHDGLPLNLPGSVVRVGHVPPARRADEECRPQRVNVRFLRRRSQARPQHAGRDLRRFVVDETTPVREVIGAGHPTAMGQRQVDQERPSRLP